MTTKMRNEYYLDLRWTISRGRDTYGYNICSLWDGDKKYSCLGGGYDMTGTVFAHFLKDNFLDKIIATCKPHCQDQDSFYGFFHRNGNYYLDGACGLSCMLEIAKAIGLEVKHLYGKNRLEGFIVEVENEN